MFALCVESSHARGMGHVFRAIQLARALERAGQRVEVLVNAHEPALRALVAAGVEHAAVDLDDARDWEAEIVARDGIGVWVNDRLDTRREHAQRVRACGIPLATFDDRGDGAADADLNVAALAFDANENLPGRRVLRGLQFLVLDPAIVKYRRLRHDAAKVVVTMGGSDTYGVTVDVVRRLQRHGWNATVITGPGFQHHAELSVVAGPGTDVRPAAPSLAAALVEFDLAITAGGITPFEANACGLPCVIVATETFEVPVGRGLARLGASVFAGHYTDLDERALIGNHPIEAMSRAGLERIPLDGADRVALELMRL